MSASDDAVQMKPQSRFQEGERILCFHGPLIYEAKCLKVRKKSDGVLEYLVHYAGWNKNWDEWTTDYRILKYNEPNLTRQRELLKAHKDARKVRCKALLNTSSTSPSTAAATDEENASVNVDTVDGNDATNSVDNNNASSTSKANENAAEDENQSPVPTTDDKSKSNGNLDVESETSSTSSRKRKRVEIEVEADVETEAEFLDKVEIKVKIPDDMKTWLVDDWDSVCRQKKLIHLPSATTVNDIVENYIKQKISSKHNSSSNKERENAAIQTARGIKEYFNATLGSQLLYKHERVQYAEILESFPDQELSSIYGAAHLLRLFVILGSLIVYTQISEKTVQILKTQLQDFLRYLQKNASNLFSLQYYNFASAEYQRKAS